MTLISAVLAVAVLAHDPGYYTSLAKHIERWLGGHGIAAKVATPKGMPAALANEKLAFLVGFVEPTEWEMTQLRNFRSRGGKLVVFHTASPQLGALMGVKPLGFTAAPTPGRWSKMVFSPGVHRGCPAAILQTSSVLQRAVPVTGRGRTIAVWADRQGRSTGDAAWIATDAGWWMTHVLLADGDEMLKAQLLASICGQVDGRLWNAAQADARARTAEKAVRDLALRQVPRPGELHAVWDHSGCGLYPGNWSRTVQLLVASHVTDLFVNVAGAGFAHYPSAVLPRSKTYETEGDQLAACLAAARGTGLRVHAWVLCFNATRATSERIADFRKRGWCLKTPSGQGTEYLNPANPSVRSRILSAVDEMLVRYPALTGIHLDFVRWYERAARPANASAVVTSFVSEARRHVKRPKWLTTAVLGKYPSCVVSVGQDWVSWLDLNLVDYVVPMDYTESSQTLMTYLAQQAATKAHARRTIAGLGVTANESRLDARQVIEQSRLVRQYGLAGVALFDLDVTLEKNILPYLRLGLWK